MVDDAPTGFGQIDFGFDRGQAPSTDRQEQAAATPVLPLPDFFVRKSPPKPSEVFKTYWRFAALRQKAFFARALGKPAEAPNDPILSRYRFTNAYRASDRVSQYLIRHVIYDRQRSHEDTFFRIILFKLFNKIETWEALTDNFGEIKWDTFKYDDYARVLSKKINAGERIYSAAYIMPSGRSAFGQPRKHQNHLRLIEMMMQDRVPDRLAQAPTLEAAYTLLRRYPCIGPFTGYQYAIDLNYSELIDFSENDFVEAGPGALDGITKCFVDPGEYAPADIIRYMTEAQYHAFEMYAPGFEDLWGRPLHLIDCQNLFCEVDKYARVAHPEVRGRSQRSRIKQGYKQSTRPIEAPWYPPNWRLNEQVAEMRSP